MPGPYPLTTLAATVDANGISAPPYTDILASLQASFRLIYGNDIYIEADSQDGQWIALLAKAIDDENKVAIATYNQFSPQTAIGVGLSQVVKVNGLRRQAASNSTAVVTIVGQAGGTIVAGLIGDSNGLGSQWALPDVVVIPPEGQIDVTATSLTEGAVTALPNTLTNILTPNPRWQTVTNSLAATPGDPIEYDYALKRRQTTSTMMPAQTPFEAMVAAVSNLTGVTRVGGRQNDRDSLDSEGLLPHSIALVIEGGDTTEIVNTIARYKAPGVNTVGSTSLGYVDSNGVPSTISFYPLSIQQIYFTVVINVGPGYADRTGDLIKAAISDHLSNLSIGQDVNLDKLWAPANLSGTSATRSSGLTQQQLDALSSTYQVMSIFIGFTSLDQFASDLVIPFASVADSDPANGSLTVVV
jgi:uncharacterized phage protein gp47/JayE